MSRTSSVKNAVVIGTIMAIGGSIGIVIGKKVFPSIIITDLLFAGFIGAMGALSIFAGIIAICFRNKKKTKR